jgi:predicted dehydrogenase/nucleoside-diphosphate-sugar epimerase
VAELPLALVGCGAVAASHARALAAVPGVRATAVFDVERERAAAFARAHLPSARVATTLDELGAAAEAAIVAVPNAAHAATSVALLEAGLHVLCEKPLALTVADAERMAAAARAAGRVLACGLVRRFFGSTELCAEALRRRLVGAPLGFEIRESVTNWPMRRSTFERAVAGGGVFIDFAPHLLDLLAAWLGPVEIVSYADDAAGGVESSARVELRAGGVPGTIVLSRAYRMTNRARIVCAGGHLDVDPHQPDRVAVVFAGGANGGLAGTLEARPRDPFAAQLSAFVAAVGGRAHAGASVDDALRAVALVDDSYRRRAPLSEPWSISGGPFLASGASAVAECRPAGGRARKILVTGATGAVGSRLVERWAAAGQLGRLRCMARGYGQAARLMRFPVEIVEADLGDRASLERAARGCDAVVHLAVGERARAETEALVATARRAGVTRLVHMSTAAVYGRRLPRCLEATQEETPLQPTGEPYADEKAAAEAVVRRSGLPAHILRPHIVYGPGLRWSAELMELLPRGAVPLVEDGGWCNLIHVDDLVDAIGCALEHERADGEPLFITDGAPLRWSEYVDAHASLIGVAPPRRRRAELEPPRPTLSSWLADSLRPIAPILRSREFRAFFFGSPAMQATAFRAYLALRHSPRVQPWLARLRSAGDAPLAPAPALDENWSQMQLSEARLDGTRAARVLGFRPRIDFAEGLRRTAAWFEAFGLMPARPAAAAAQAAAR